MNLCILIIQLSLDFEWQLRWNHRIFSKQYFVNILKISVVQYFYYHYAASHNANVVTNILVIINFIFCMFTAKRIHNVPNNRWNYLLAQMKWHNCMYNHRASLHNDNHFAPFSYSFHVSFVWATLI